MSGPQPGRLLMRDLERIARRRAEVRAVEAADDRQAATRRLLLDTLDDLEEALCVFGRRSPAAREGWRRLACFESFGDGGDGGRNGG